MLTATVLTDAHKHGPAHFGLPSLYLMNDHDDECSDTMASPPPSQDDIATNPHASEAPLRRTQPPEADDAQAERVMRTMIPAPGTTPRDLVSASDSLLFEAIREVTGAARILREEREERARFEERSQRNHEATIAAILKADANQTRNYEMVRDEIRHLKDSDVHQNRRLADGDERFGRIERSIADLKDELIALITRATQDAGKRIAALEDELAAAKASRDPAPTPT
jgi:hypothetical protein